MFYKRFIVFIFCTLETIIKEIQGLFDMMTLLFGIKDVIWQSFCFQNEDTITLRQAFLSIYLYKSDEASCNILVTENIKDFRRNFKIDAHQRRRLDSTGDNYNPSLYGLVLKSIVNILNCQILLH